MARCSVWCGVILCLCAVFFFLGLNVLLPVLLNLYAWPSRPSFAIKLFDDQPFNITRARNVDSNNSPKNLTILFHLKLKNENSAIGLHYPDPLKLTFAYFPNVSMMVTLAEYTIHSFYQGNGKTKHVRELVETTIMPTVLEGTDMVAFRVDLVGAFRYKKAGTKRHRFEVGCVVLVNYTTSEKILTGFIGLAKPGLDSKLKPPPKDHNDD